MRRELLAAALLALLVLGAGWNIRVVDRLTADIMECLDRSEASALEGHQERSKEALEQGLDLWLEADSYTHIFIRHSEIDSTTDAFYEALEELSDNDCEATSAAFEKLRYHLRSLNTMEHVSLGSIL